MKPRLHLFFRIPHPQEPVLNGVKDLGRGAGVRAESIIYSQ
jgi:hypothetical protein